MKYLVIMYSIIYSLGKSLEEEPVSSVMSVNYTEIAGEAELHKHDILSFLNETRVRKRYKVLFDDLLSKLVDNKQNTKIKIRRDSTRRIVSGRNTSILAVPWQASLRDKGYPICGASVITDKWLLTAAHCLLKAREVDLSIRVGSSWKTHGGEIYDVEEIITHPKYASKRKINDVGLLKLYTTLRFSARILPISVVAKNSKLRGDEYAIVSGWGKLKEGGPGATFLQSTTVKTINMKQCRQSSLDVKAIDPASMFCAGYLNQPSSDACQGDSGGPLVQEGVLIGVVSWGLGCARGNFPGVYTRLANDAIWDWVHDLIISTDKTKTNKYHEQ